MNPQTLDPLPRLILIPKDASLAESGTVPHTLRAVAAAVRAANASRPSVRGLHVVDRSRPDGAVLVEPGGLTVDDVKAVAPDMKVFEEQWYELERFDLVLPRLARSRSKAGAGAERLWTVVVRADGAPLKDVRVGGGGHDGREGDLERLAPGIDVGQHHRPRPVQRVDVQRLHAGHPRTELERGAAVAVGDGLGHHARVGVDDGRDAHVLQRRAAGAHDHRPEPFRAHARLRP